MDGVVLLSGWSTLCVKLLLALIPYTPAPSGDPTDHTDQLIGVNIGVPLLVLIYGTSLDPLEEEIQVVYMALLDPFHVDDASFDGSAHVNPSCCRLSWSGSRLRDPFLSWSSS